MGAQANNTLNISTKELNKGSPMPSLTAFIKSLLIATVIGLVGAGLFIYSGLYPIGADVPHNKLSYWLLETLRERSIARAASDIQIPDNLNTSDRLLAADAHEHEHSGGSDDDGNDAAIQRQFWIIKHGIKASGMPAWGPTHSDERIWNMVAFLQRLPSLTPDQYQILT